MHDRWALPVIAANIIGALLVYALAAWLIVTFADHPGPRPSQGPARGAIPTPTAAYPR